MAIIFRNRDCWKPWLCGVLTATCLTVCSCSEDPYRLRIVDDVCGEMDDTTFVKYCLAEFDTDGNGKISMREAVSVEAIDVGEKGIQSLKGIEYFTEITYLNCYRNELKTLNLQYCQELEVLYCSYNSLASLDLGRNSVLEEVECHHNDISVLDVRRNLKLRELCCSYNPLKTLYLNSQHANGRIYLVIPEDTEVKYGY